MSAATDFVSDHLFSDLHKDAYGFRPTAGQWQRWATLSIAELESEYDSMIADLEAEQARQKESDALAVAAFESEIATMMRDHGISRADAIRWDVMNYDVDGDMDFYAYLRGLPYTYLGA